MDSRPTFSNSAMRVIAFFFLDAGVFSRGHRINLMSTSMHYVGIGIHPFTVNGVGRDKITMHYGDVNACCRPVNCPFNAATRANMHWNNIPAASVGPICAA
jgi:hypothetical protein